MRNASNADKLAANLAAEWLGLQYDPDTEKGSVRVPNVGVVEFREASNDPAVVVEVPAFRFKCSAHEAKKILLMLSKLIGSV